MLLRVNVGIVRFILEQNHVRRARCLTSAFTDSAEFVCEWRLSFRIHKMAETGSHDNTYAENCPDESERADSSSSQARARAPTHP